MVPYHKQVLAAIAAVVADGGRGSATGGGGQGSGPIEAALSREGGGTTEDRRGGVAGDTEWVESQSCAKEDGDGVAASMEQGAVQAAAGVIPSCSRANLSEVGGSRDAEVDTHGLYQQQQQQQTQGIHGFDSPGQGAPDVSPADQLYGMLVDMGLLRR